MQIRPSKEICIKAAVQLTPQYADLLHDLQKNNQRVSFCPEIMSIQKNLGKYVLMYDDERKIGRAVLLFLFGTEGLQEFNNEFNRLNQDEQGELIDELSEYDQAGMDKMFADFIIPQTKEEWRAADEAFKRLPEDEQKSTATKGAYFWSFVFSSFFNTLSLMVHGTKLTKLVPLAITGDDDAFLKSIQIDRMLLNHHPYFIQRKLEAQNNGELEFLSQIAYRESNPPVRGKIQYPALYMLFGILEAYGWLNDLTNEEINDICDEAELDRWQNRIEDPSYITKRRINYRQYQKTGGVSMH